MAARVEGQTTLKYYRKGAVVSLKPTHLNDPETQLDAARVDIRGVLLAVIRQGDR